MSEKDIETKAYIRENTVFADAFNFLIYNGRKIIHPDKLRELDTTELALLVDAEEKRKNETVQKYRDLLKSAVVMQGEQTTYLILGIENQSEIHYAMPVRNMIYDALQYGNQVAAIADRNKRERKATTRAEFLSGFRKCDKLRPVITLVIHFGAEKWDGAVSLHEMLDLENEELRVFIQDYKIHLIDPAELTREELLKFSTSLREVLGCIKYSQDKEQLSLFMKDNPRMKMETNAARVIRAMTNINIDIPEEAEEVDMCKAIEDMIEERSEERERKGREEGAVTMLIGLVRDGFLTKTEAARRVNMTERAFEKKMKQMS